MYNKEDRSVANDRFRAVMKQLQKLDREEEFKSACLGVIEKYRNEVTKLRIQMEELQTKVDLYEKYISYYQSRRISIRKMAEKKMNVSG